MTIGIRYAARSDVGMLREGNEDSAYAGTRLLAVADGMGGHVGGEIASAAAIDALRRLDADVPAAELLAALERAVKQANQSLHRIVEGDPTLQGMGTTLTAMLWSGSQVALVHIGDSRAYLLRNGELFQITHDHTLVQSLVDEGRISIDEAAVHPQRSLLLRALDGRGEVDPDLQLREARVGDRYLLCSDGLSGVVSAETIHEVLTTIGDPEHTVRQLIDLANRGGGPDNITCVVADVIELVRPPATARPVLAGAAANAGGPPGPDGAAPTMAEDTPAQRARQLGDTVPQPAIGVEGMPPPGPAPTTAPFPESRHTSGRSPRRRRGWGWLIVVVIVFVALLGGAGFLGLRHLNNRYYVTVDADDKNKVAIYQEGVPGLRESKKTTDQPSPPVLVNDLPKDKREQVIKTIDISGVAAANREVEELRAAVCRYMIVAEGEDVRVVLGPGEQIRKCDAIPDQEIPKLKLNELPLSDQDRVKRGISIPSREAVGLELRQLTGNRDACKKNANAKQDCPK